MMSPPAISHLHRLEKVFTRGVSLPVILDRIGGEIREPIVWVIGMVEKDFLRLLTWNCGA